MLRSRAIEGIVGLFILAAIIALMVLAFKVSGLTSFFKEEGYIVTADFTDIGQLKVRAPVKISGVRVGEVSDIELDPTTFKAVVQMRIDYWANKIPIDSAAGILTSGLLGDNYIAITPMYSEQFLKNGDVIQDTQSAMILEKLIGQLLFKIGNTGESKDKSSS